MLLALQVNVIVVVVAVIAIVIIELADVVALVVACSSMYTLPFVS